MRILCPCRSLKIVSCDCHLLLNYDNCDDDVDIEIHDDNHVLVVQFRRHSTRKKKSKKKLNIFHRSGKDQPTVRRRGCEAADHCTGEKKPPWPVMQKLFCSNKE